MCLLYFVNFAPPPNAWRRQQVPQRGANARHIPAIKRRKSGVKRPFALLLRS